MSAASWHPETTVIALGRPAPVPDAPLNVPISPASALQAGGASGYARSGHPSWQALEEVLGAPVLFLGISIPSDGWHAPNEKVELDLLFKGVETSAYLWDDLAEHWRGAP